MGMVRYKTHLDPRTNRIGPGEHTFRIDGVKTFRGGIDIELSKPIARCGCPILETLLMLHPVGDTGAPIIECDGCGATWALFAERLSMMEIDGKKTYYIVPDSLP